ncbi:Uncharacterized protein Fot_13620 [Forsythia ovata]|uniref:Uncharacterized protein n=1 Tax=Forsythia ovata TaxID=205694 RepID=A0ABD1W496_9LAMI
MSPAQGAHPQHFDLTDASRRLRKVRLRGRVRSLNRPKPRRTDRFILNRYKKTEADAFRPTPGPDPGHSPGMGHNSPPGDDVLLDLTKTGLTRSRDTPMGRVVDVATCKKAVELDCQNVGRACIGCVEYLRSSLNCCRSLDNLTFSKSTTTSFIVGPPFPFKSVGPTNEAPLAIKRIPFRSGCKGATLYIILE